MSEIQQIEYSHDQLAALEKVLSDVKVVIVDGGAGRGKTTLLRAGFERFQSQGHKPVLCAPTGKAARRVTQLTGIAAVTIHKLLEYGQPDLDEDTGKPVHATTPGRHIGRPLDYNVVFVDEAAMVDETLYRNLCDAIPRNGSGLLRMFGDANQLQPISAGPFGSPQTLSPFMRGLARKDCGATLKTMHRFGEGSSIAKNGDLIRQGRAPARYPDFRLHPTTEHTRTLHKLLDPTFGGLDAQIITPGNKGWVGTAKLNTLIQNVLNLSDPNKRRQIGRHKWQAKDKLSLGINDKVIMTKNWYTLGIDGLFNGETGIVVDMDDDALYIDFGHETVCIPDVLEFEYKGELMFGRPQRDLQLGYALTTHKCQGSEFSRVVYIGDSSHYPLLCRQNYYTAITRARKEVDVIYNSRVANLMLRDGNVGVLKHG